jgi:hypothetical protein
MLFQQQRQPQLFEELVMSFGSGLDFRFQRKQLGIDCTEINFFICNGLPG